MRASPDSRPLLHLSFVEIRIILPFMQSDPLQSFQGSSIISKTSLISSKKRVWASYPKPWPLDDLRVWGFFLLHSIRARHEILSISILHSHFFPPQPRLPDSTPTREKISVKKYHLQGSGHSWTEFSNLSSPPPKELEFITPTHT